MPAFSDLLQRVAEYYRAIARRSGEQNAQLSARIRLQLAAEGGGRRRCWTHAPLERARDALEQSFDPHFGGFGGAPKFPHPEQHRALPAALARTRRSQPTSALYMASSP